MPADGAPGAGLSERGAAIVREEEALLARVIAHLATAAIKPSRPPPVENYEEQLLSLRDQIAAARLEDVPALEQQMERLASDRPARAARERRRARRPEVSPYFGHLRLREKGRPERDVLIGATTLVDAKRGRAHRRLAARAGEPDLLPLRGGRGVRGDLRRARRRGHRARAAHRHHRRRRALRISAPQGTFVRGPAGGWREIGAAGDRALRRPGQAPCAPRTCPRARGGGRRTRRARDGAAFARPGGPAPPGDRGAPRPAAVRAHLASPTPASSSSRAAPAAARRPSASTAWRSSPTTRGTASPPTRCSSSSAARRSARTSARCSPRSAWAASRSRPSPSGRATAASARSRGSRRRSRRTRPRSSPATRPTRRCSTSSSSRAGGAQARRARAARLARRPRLLGGRAHRSRPGP